MNQEIPDTADNHLKVIALGEHLCGTCKSGDEGVAEIFGEGVELTNLSAPLLEELDEITMCCEVCGWWCETGFLNDQQVCDDCEPNTENDDE